MNKKCYKCNKNKNIAEFNKKGTNRYSSYCKDCNKEYQKKYYKDNTNVFYQKNKKRKEKIREYISSYKKDLCCENCGENHPATLDFHHKSSDEKKFNIGMSVNHGVSLKSIKEEIDKCIILCSNCHRKYHWSKKHII